MKKEAYINIRCNALEKEQIRQAAKNEKMTMSEYMLSLAKENIAQTNNLSRFENSPAVQGNIKEVINNSKMNLKEISEMLEIPYRTIQNWKDGKREPAGWVVKLISYRINHDK